MTKICDYGLHYTVFVFCRYKWKKVFLIYEKQGYSTVSGPDTCKLMVDSLAGFLKLEKDIIYNSYDTSLNAEEGFKENLRRELQYTYSSESNYCVLTLLCMDYWCVCGACDKMAVPETLKWMIKGLSNILTTGRALYLYIFVRFLLLSVPCPSAYLLGNNSRLVKAIFC